MDLTAVSAFIADAQADAITIGLAVTVLVFAIKATKWLRRAG